jgi:HK97 family phage portal protein
MKIIDRIKASIGRRTASWWTNELSWGALVPGNAITLSGVSVDPDKALGLTAAYAAINVIASDVAMLPLKVYQKQAGGGRAVAAMHPVNVLLGTSPDGETTSMRWRQAALGHVLGWGNGYAEIIFDGDGYPVRLPLMDPSGTRPERRPADRQIVYRNGDRAELIPAYRVLHFAGLGFDGLSGYSPVAKAREAIALGLAAEAFGAGLFGNGSRPSGVLTTPQKLDEKAVKNLRTSWEQLHRGPENAGRVAILEQGLDWKSITINPEDAQFLATRQFQVVEVARLFRLPPHKIGDYTQSHLANIEAANLDYLTTTIAPWCESIEQELNRKLFTSGERAAGLYVEHDMRAFMRGDMKARAEYFTKMRDLGVFTPNLISEWENLDPIGPEGDIRLVPLNMTTLANAGKPTEPAAPGGLTDEPDDDEPDDETNG